jgi:protein gp37
MGDKTGISWTDATWNPIVGCSIISPACTNCYAMAQADRIQRMAPNSHYDLTTKIVNGKPVWTGVLKQSPDHIQRLPLRWKRPRRIFVNSMSDLFHSAVPEAWIDYVFAIMALSSQHTFQVLTKRPERMRAYLSDPGVVSRVWMLACTIGQPGRSFSQTVVRFGNPWPLLNVWIGITAERQQEADERIPHLLASPAVMRFISAEPLLGPLDIGAAVGWRGADGFDPFAPRIGWLICGGESGPGARLTHPQWPRSLRDQCSAAGVAFFFKQWGEWSPAYGDTLRPRKAVSLYDGSSFDIAAGERPRQIDLLDMAQMIRIGKRAGDLLDSVEHKEFPRC